MKQNLKELVRLACLGMFFSFASWYAFLLLLAALGAVFGGGGYILASNDGPLGYVLAQHNLGCGYNYAQWNDLNWLGYQIPQNAFGAWWWMLRPFVPHYTWFIITIIAMDTVMSEKEYNRDYLRHHQRVMRETGRAYDPWGADLSWGFLLVIPAGFALGVGGLWLVHKVL